jgi:hypothetical protein
MLTVEEAIVARLAADTTLANLLGASGGDARIYHALEAIQPKTQCVTYMHVTSVPGDINGLNVAVQDELYVFNIYHKQYEKVKERIYSLLQNYRFPTPSDAGIKSCVWEWEGPDEFDERLQVGLKRARFRLSVVRSAQAPV